MVNSYATYYDAGFKAGMAMRQHDISLYNFQRDWYRKARAIENDTDKTEAGTAWDQGYHAGRNL